jgi:lipoyl(octanoyl) transferase
LVERPHRLGSIWLGSVSYAAAWALQRRLAQARAADEIGDCLLLLEHPPVYTLGRNTAAVHLGPGPEALRALGAECLEVDRGGSVTFHGPGQLVAYPILRLADHFPLGGEPERGDAVAYVRGLEEALIRTAAAFGVGATRRPGYAGAWVGMEKLAAIGVKLAGGVTQHGVALNIDTDLTWFRRITPCGIADGGVTSLEQLGATGLTPAGVAPAFAAALGALLSAGVEPASPALREMVRAGLPSAGQESGLVGPHARPDGSPAPPSGEQIPAGAVGPATGGPPTPPLVRTGSPG